MIPPSNSDETIYPDFKFGFFGGFEKTIVGTGVPDGPFPNGQKYMPDLRYFGPSRTPVPTVPFLRFI